MARSDKLLHLVQDGVLTDGEAAAALELRACADRPFAGMVSAYEQKVDYYSRPGEAAVNHWHHRQQLRGALGHLNSGLNRVARGYILEEPGFPRTFTAIGRTVFPDGGDEQQRIAGKTLVIETCRELAILFGRTNPVNFETGIAGIKATTYNQMTITALSS
jgi:hypothetical protein